LARDLEKHPLTTVTVLIRVREKKTVFREFTGSTIGIRSVT
jgi:hypothetical protein